MSAKTRPSRLPELGIRCMLALALALALPAAVQAAQQAARTTDAASRANPAVLYHNYCSVCHGDRGDGKSRASNSLVTPPRDFTSEPSRRELSEERMFQATRNGVPGTAMTSWKTQLSDPEIRSLVQYIQATFMKPFDNPALVRGRRVYQETCAVCHGDRGQGAVWAGANMRTPPRDFRSPQAAAELDRERMITAVTHGRPGTQMAAFGKQLAGEDIAAVVDFIRTTLMLPTADGISGVYAHGLPRPDSGKPAPGAVTQATAAKPSAAPVSDMSVPMPRGLAADPGKGKAFYLANCATCHGAKGDGQGPRAYFINPKPRNLVDAGSRALFNRPALYAAISEGKLGTEMPAWSKVLSEQEIANVTEFVFREFIRPGEPARPASAAAR